MAQLTEVKAMLKSMEGAPGRVAGDLAEQILTYARENSRVDTGKMKAGWRVRVTEAPTGLSITLTNRTEYAAYQKPDVASDAIKAARVDLDGNLEG